MMEINVKSVFLYILLLVSNYVYSQTYYDEIYDESGKVKPQYSEVLKVYNKLSKTKKEEFAKQTKIDLTGDNEINILPRIITENEFKTIQTGVSQRATALKMFLEDHYSGRKSYLKENVIPSTVLDEIVKRHGSEDWDKYLKNHKFTFFYGPDIVRIEDGSFAVIEDNIGYLGGFGDLYHARKSIVDLVPEYANTVDVEEPLEYYKNLIEKYKQSSKVKDGIIVSLQTRYASDHEEARLKQIYKTLGVEVVEVTDDFYRHGNVNKYLDVNEDGVFLVKKLKSGKTVKKKVGFVMSNMSFNSIDSSHPAVRKNILISEANTILDYWNGVQKKKKGYSFSQFNKIYYPKGVENSVSEIQYIITQYQGGNDINYTRLEEIVRSVNRLQYYSLDKKSGVIGLIQAFLDGKVGLNYSPGTEFIEDKEFYMYVDRLIEFYLNEKPILQNLKTESFRSFELNGTSKLNEKLLISTINNIEKYVFKGVDGLGGNMVWIGPKMKKEDIPALVERIKKQYSKMIVQEYHHPSVLDGRIVDMRDYALVGENVGDVFVSPVIWGRDTPVSGDGKVNISANGNETVIVVEKKGKHSCKKYLH